MAAVAMPAIDEQIAFIPRTVSVIVCADDVDDWTDIVGRIDALEHQTRPPEQVVLVVDHDDDLLQLAADHVAEASTELRVDVVANLGRRGRTGARNTGAEWSDGDVVAFVDDEVTDRYWIATLMEDYLDPMVAGVGGGATPDWDGAEAPAWFPEEFGWVVDCSYVGSPTEAEDVDVFVGTTVSYRREVLDEVGSFTDGVGGREADYCARIRRRFGQATLIFDPDLSVVHRVGSAHRGFTHFRDRCWHAGLTSAAAVDRHGHGLGLPAERAYTAKVLPRGVARGLGDVARGRVSGVQRAGAIVVGFTWMAAGYSRGRITRTFGG